MNNVFVAYYVASTILNRVQSDTFYLILFNLFLLGYFVLYFISLFSLLQKNSNYLTVLWFWDFMPVLLKYCYALCYSKILRVWYRSFQIKYYTSLQLKGLQNCKKLQLKAKKILCTHAWSDIFPYKVFHFKVQIK